MGSLKVSFAFLLLYRNQQNAFVGSKLRPTNASCQSLPRSGAPRSGPWFVGKPHLSGSFHRVQNLARTPSFQTRPYVSKYTGFVG